MSDHLEPSLISIVTINYNQIEVTCEFLDSLRKVSYKNYEIIVVDNASVLNPTSIIEEKYPEVQLIVNKENLGFSGGNNVGIKAAKGSYIFMVNNDTELTEDIFEKLLAPFSTDTSIGVVCPKIRFFNPSDVIQYAGFTKVNPMTGRNRKLGFNETDQGQHNHSGITHYAHGAAMMVKKEVLEKVGLLPEIFFLYYEELDWSARVISHGYKIYYQSSALIFHKESVSVGKESITKAYYSNRNRILFMRRNFSKYHFFIFMAFFSLFTVPKTLLSYLIKFKINHIKAFLQAIAWNFRYKDVADF